MTTFEIVLPSKLWPFTLQDLERFDYGRYRLENVFNKITQPQRQACVDMWMRNQVIVDEKSAWERSNQICYMMIDLRSDKVIGVNTLYSQPIQMLNRSVYFNRMFIDRNNRDSRLMIVGTAITFCYGKVKLENNGQSGIALIFENQKLTRPGLAKCFNSHGCHKVGNYNGQEVWYFDFANTVITEG